MVSVGSSPPVRLVREKIARNAATCDPALAKVYDYTPDQLADTPAVVVDMPNWEAMTFGRNGPWRLDVDVHLAIGTSWDEAAQHQLDTLVPALYEALESDKTLDGLGFMHVESVRTIKRLEVADVGYSGALFNVEVFAT